MIGESHSHPCLVPVPVFIGAAVPHQARSLDLSPWSPWIQSCLTFSNAVDVSLIQRRVKTIGDIRLPHHFLIYADFIADDDVSPNQYLTEFHTALPGGEIFGNFIVVQTDEQGTVQDFDASNEALALHLIRM